MKRVVGRKRIIGVLLGICALSALLVQGPPPQSPAADHRDSPSLLPTSAVGDRDINDIFIFRSPTNVANTVFVFTFQPFPGSGTGITAISANPVNQYDIRIDTTGDAVEEIIFRVTFGPPDAQGIQNVTLRGLPSSRFGTSPLATGRTGQNLQIAGGGMFRAAIQDDPFFFDAGGAGQGGFGNFLNSNGDPNPTPTGFPRQPGRNFFGPGANTFAYVIEIPSSRIGPDASLIATYVAIVRNGFQTDRMGRPAISAAVIPPIPRGSNFPLIPGVQNRTERRSAFNQALPRNDVRDFRSDMISVLTNFNGYRQSMADAQAIASTLLPDVLVFQLGNDAGFGTFLTPPASQPGFAPLGVGTLMPGLILGNGRKLRDDTLDTELNILTDGRIPNDNLSDDNGPGTNADGSPNTGITDGDPRFPGTPALFPFIGPPNTPLTNPNGTINTRNRRDTNP